MVVFSPYPLLAFHPEASAGAGRRAHRVQAESLCLCVLRPNDLIASPLLVSQASNPIAAGSYHRISLQFILKPAPAASPCLAYHASARFGEIFIFPRHVPRTFTIHTRNKNCTASYSLLLLDDDDDGDVETLDFHYIYFPMILWNCAISFNIICSKLLFSFQTIDFYNLINSS